MINNLFAGKKLLLIGSQGLTLDMIELAHRNGIKIGATDYNPDTYVKCRADYKHDVSTIDINALTELVKKEQYDGVISSYSDMLSPYVCEVAEKACLPTNFSASQLKLSTDKRYFKEVCISHFVPVPKEYVVDSADCIDEGIEYPVIVKPTDGMAARGISICNNKNELIQAIDFAQHSSKSGKFIIEQFIAGDEINLTYIAVNGDIQLAAIHDRYFTSHQESKVKMPDLYIYPSRYTDLVLQNYNQVIISMLKSQGITNGSIFLQACIRDNRMYVYEAGMRLNGCKTYQILEYESDYNTQEQLMRYAVSGDMGPTVPLTPKFQNWYATINVLTKVGKKIVAFEGLNELLSYPWVIAINRLYFEGDTIPEKAFGTLGQRISTIHVTAKTKEELLKRIERVNLLYKVIDEDGQNILIEPHDSEDIKRSLNYELN